MFASIEKTGIYWGRLSKFIFIYYYGIDQQVRKDFNWFIAEDKVGETWQ